MHIYLVDDSSLYRSVLEPLLSEVGGTLHHAANGQLALELAATQPADLVIGSMQLTDMDGIALTQKLRQLPSFKYTPVVILSSSLSKEFAQQAERAGVTEVFRKQDIGELVQFMRRFLIRFRPLDGKVLYVEDDLSQRQVMTMQLREWGLQVDSFENADSAWQLYLDGGYDLVITDIMLDGGMSGSRFVNRIRRQDGREGDIPVLALTAFDTAARRIQLFHLGVSDYVTKPALPEELYSRIHSLLSTKQLVDRDQELRQAVARADQANHAKSQYLSSMSHELRTPMTAIVGYARLLEHGDNLRADQRDFVQGILKASDHLLNLVKEVLDLAKIEAGHIDISIEPVELDALIEECVSLVRPLVDKAHIALTYEGLPGAMVQADRIRLKQVLLNLLSNAIKYNSEGGSIQVRSEEKDGSSLRVSVKDSGQGIAPERMPELFEPFQRLGAENSSIEGAGIGLTISRRITERMSGTMGVKSEVGVGSTFWIELPSAQ